MRCAITCLVNARHSQTTCIRHESHVSPDLQAAAAQTWEPPVIYNAISPCVPERLNVSLHVCLQDIFGSISSITRVFFFLFFFARLCSEPPDKEKWLLACPIVLYTACWPVYTGLSMWARPWNCNKAGASHREDGWLCSARKYEILPFVYVYVCLCLRKNNIGRAPSVWSKCQSKINKDLTTCSYCQLVFLHSLCKTFLLRGDYVYDNMSACPGVISTLHSEAMHCKLLYTLHHVCLNNLSEKPGTKSFNIFLVSKRFLEERQPELMPGKITTSPFHPLLILTSPGYYEKSN